MVWLAVAAFIGALALAALVWRAWTIDRKQLAGIFTAGAVLLAAGGALAVNASGDAPTEKDPVVTGPELVDRPGPPTGTLQPVTTAPPAPSAVPH
ncbi:hypothetical protein GS504_01795 [Rhodococcus hoagii]|nr:hypothetical protein [Prescottella equi]NKS72244.1 hypothetical protein [Prescottella equi]